ncbi:MAG TPA: MauE/DoxX family redox-associated membrane protein [Thermoanaerobaculia bacterium]|nr:MauE/DoxX family redox-associated membrane protein [Thermoanaerobaculia bacterium]
MKILRILSIGFLAGLFLFTGLDKAFHYSGFVKALDGYVLVPRGLGPHLALPLIACELWVGVSLLVRPWRPAAAAAATLLLTLFTIAFTVNQHYAPGAECGCWFTITVARATSFHIVQDLILLGLAATLWLEERRAAALAGEVPRSLP